MRIPVSRLLALAGLGLGFGTAACGEQAPPRQETPRDVKRPVAVRATPPPAERIERPTLGPGEYALREYVDLSGRVSAYPARINGSLWLLERLQRAVVRLSIGQLLEGSVLSGTTLHEASGTWRREGDEVIVEGLDLAVGRIEVFLPRGATRRWRIEREGDAELVRAGPFTFERDATR